MKIGIDDLKFDERGLVPAVVQDAATGEVLTVAYMSAESLRRTLESGETWFWSRSRAELWHKGATSGHTQRVVNVAADCDADALRVAVEPRGPACHTGARSCFTREVAGPPDNRPTENDESFATEDTAGASGAEISDQGFQIRDPQPATRGPSELGATLDALYELIARRRRELPENSYTAYLFKEGLDKILKKVGEESAETIIAAKNADAGRLVAEVSDLMYHLLVLLAERGATLAEVNAELARRAGKGGGE